MPVTGHAHHGRIRKQIHEFIAVVGFDGVVVNLPEKAGTVGIRDEIRPVDIAPVLVAVDPAPHLRRQGLVGKGRQIHGGQFIGLVHHGGNEVFLDTHPQRLEVVVTAPQAEIPSPTVFPVGRGGGDRTRLQDDDLPVPQGPFHILGPAEKRFDPAGQGVHGGNHM